MAGSLLLLFVLWNIIYYFCAKPVTHCGVVCSAVWVLFALSSISLHLITALLLYTMDINTETDVAAFCVCLRTERERSKSTQNIPLLFLFSQRAHSAASFSSHLAADQPATKSVRIGQRTRFLTPTPLCPLVSFYVCLLIRVTKLDKTARTLTQFLSPHTWLLFHTICVIKTAEKMPLFSNESSKNSHSHPHHVIQYP